MLTLAITTLFFAGFLFLGNLLQFLDMNAYYTIPVFILFLIFCSIWYKEANTKSLEGKDFLLTLLLVGILYYFYQTFDFTVSKVFFTYYYLAGFTCVVLYADSIRFKSLM